MSRGFGPAAANGSINGSVANGQGAIRKHTLPGTSAALIREACHAIGIIITAYLPIFTLQRVEGKLFMPMAWTVAFALLGAMTF